VSLNWSAPLKNLFVVAGSFGDVWGFSFSASCMQGERISQSAKRLIITKPKKKCKKEFLPTSIATEVQKTHSRIARGNGLCCEPRSGSRLPLPVSHGGAAAAVAAG
jgi:hypothetical protein